MLSYRALSQLLRLSPDREQLRALLDHAEGDLADTSFATLLLALALDERSAVLELRRGPLFKKIVFDAGAPVDCTSNIATESLGRYLVAVGKLNEGDYPLLLSAATSRGVALGTILQERQLITAAELDRILQQSLGRKLLDAFNWRSGSYRISSEVPPFDAALRVKVPQLIFTGLTKFETQETIDETFADARDLRFRRAAVPLVDAEELRLTPEQSNLVNALRDESSIEQLVTKTALPAEDATRLLYALLFLGIAEPVSVKTAVAVPFLQLELEDEPDAPLQHDVFDEPESPSPAVIPASAPFFERRKTSRDEVLRLFATFRRKDPFELLGVPEDASAVAVTRAYLSFAETFAPSQFTERDADEVREKAEQIFLAGARAYAELADDERRRLLVERRRKAADDTATRRATMAGQAVRPATQAPPPLREPEPAALIDPEALYQEGRRLAEAGKLREALGNFEMAADCDAQNGTYAAELAYCRFQLLITPAANVLKQLKNVMRIDPRCGAAYLYTGKVHAALGNKLEAEGYLRRAVSMMPRDRRPHDALKQLAS